MKIIFNENIFQRILWMSQLCLGLAVSLPSCLEPHQIPDNEHVDQVHTGGDAMTPGGIGNLSYKDVRDIFDHYNCSVCHMDDQKLDLRRYPFRFVGTVLSPEKEMWHKIWQQLVSKHEPDQGILPIRAAELERLERWRSQGLRPDGPSPLVSP